MKKLDSLDIVLSIYNQEDIIVRVLSGIVKNTTTPFNLILVFDGCTDSSIDKALAFMKSAKPAFLRDLRVLTSPNVYETRANNIGFRHGTEDHLITIQDDMVIEEKGWERRLTYPIRAFDDIFAVTARTALNTTIDPDTKTVRYQDVAARESFSLRRNVFAIRNSINRGPIAFRADILRKLDFLDEAFAPSWLDEADIVLRAYESFGMKSGAFWIDYRSDDAWGKTRSSSSTMDASRAMTKNSSLLLKKHPLLAKAR